MEVKCPVCELPLEVTGELMGQRVSCPSCEACSYVAQWCGQMTLLDAKLRMSAGELFELKRVYKFINICDPSKSVLFPTERIAKLYAETFWDGRNANLQYKIVEFHVDGTKEIPFFQHKDFPYSVEEELKWQMDKEYQEDQDFYNRPIIFPW